MIRLTTKIVAIRRDYSMQEINILEAFNDRVRRHVSEALRRYRDEQKALSNEMAARGLFKSGGHLKRRVEVLRKWTVALTDQCFEDVARLPGQQVMHRLVHAEFLTEQFQNFLRQAEGDIFVFDSPPAAKTEVEKLIAQVREGLDHDLHDFQAGLWRPRAKEKETSVTNIVNINGPNMGIVQQCWRRIDSNSHHRVQRKLG
jgi:hypothetical protein